MTFHGPISFLVRAPNSVARGLFLGQLHKLTLKIEKVFGALFIFQWFSGILFAIFISPNTWSGEIAQTHIHIYAAIFLGGLLALFPMSLIYFVPGRPVTRHVIAVSQVLVSTLLIHLSGGRIETHFHIFVSLAFLAFFRDWKVLVTGTLVVLIDHLLRGIFWPQSVYGVLSATPWRTLEHASWVIFEDIVLLYSTRMALQETMSVAVAESEVRKLNQELELKVLERTRELKATKDEAEKTSMQFRAIFDNAAVGIIVADENLNIILSNNAIQKMLGYDSAELSCKTITALTHPDDLDEVTKNIGHVSKDTKLIQFKRYLKKDGSLLWIRLSASIQGESQAGFKVVGIIEDRTAQRIAEDTVKEQQTQLQDSAVRNAHNAGMSEVATGVLHNVGNVLNSANVGLEAILSKLNNSAIENLYKANELLSLNKDRLLEFLDKDPKGKKLIDFYLELGPVLKSEISEQKSEAQELMKKLQLIKDIVSTQQSFAKGSSEFKEQVSLLEVIENVLIMESTALVRHEIKVLKKFSLVPPIMAQKAKLTHVLLNLIKNAKEAMGTRDSRDKLLTLELNQDSIGNIFFKVSDTGTGIAPENLTKVFSHGFTTKQTGHGFGLHFCANSVAEMGAKISVTSEGLNKGASFYLEFGETLSRLKTA